MADFISYTVEEVKEIHRFVLIRSHEEAMDGVLNEGSPEIAVEAPHRHVYGGERYPDPISKIGTLMYELTTLHPFVEGNKRTGFMCADTLLVLNDLLLITTPEARY